MFHLIVTNDEEVVRFARERGAGVFTAEKLPEGFPPTVGKVTGGVSEVYDLLRMLDFRTSNKGYRYLKFMMEQCHECSDYHEKSITKEIYPECAKKFNTTASRVERAIRHALDVSFESVPEKYSQIFGGKFQKAPTNQEFIGLVTEYFANNR